MPLRMCMLARGAIRPCSTRMVFAFSPSTGMSDVSWASCTRSVVCCSSHPWILPYCEIDGKREGRGRVPLYRRRTRTQDAAVRVSPAPAPGTGVAAGCWLDMASGVYKYKVVLMTCGDRRPECAMG